MRKIVLTAGLAALLTATPALATKGPSQGPLSHFIHGAFSTMLVTPPGFSSPDKHRGWFIGRHLGWFKPHNPHFPHPVSP